MAHGNSRAKLIYLATIAEQAERYEDMLHVMNSLVKFDVELSSEEYKLLSSAYRNVLGQKRSSWRTFQSIKEEEEAQGNAEHVQYLSEFIGRVETELNDMCYDILTILDQYLVVSATTAESKVFYFRMKGDCYRYMAEIAEGEEKQTVCENALAAYKSAHNIAIAELPATHPTRLGLALSFSVFYYEVFGSVDRGLHMAKQAFDEAIGGLASLSEEAQKEATPLLQVLRDNVALWACDMH